MKPVAIFRHARTEGPGYFAEYLDRRGIPWQLLPVDQGEVVPAGPDAFSGLAFMGGPMSVNDDLPWIPRVLNLIRAAVGQQVPVLGHCLGGQLMAKALGGMVARNPVKEIGWGRCDVAEDPIAREWFGGLRAFDSFHWHGETFALPAGAVRILSSPYCENQAFAMGPHLAMQCHVEMTEDLIRVWCRGGAREIDESRTSPGVQTPEEIQRDLAPRVDALHQVAGRLYDRWTRGLR
ncbi:MAG: type 1 glutamine amidotransferase [Burkholderiales bacterium]